MVLLPPQRQEASDTRHSPGNLGRLAGPLALTQLGLGGSSPRVFSGRSAWPRLPGRLSGVPSPWPLYSAHPPQPLLSTVPRVSFITQGLLLPGVRARGCARPARADWTGSGVAVSLSWPGLPSSLQPSASLGVRARPHVCSVCRLGHWSSLCPGRVASACLPGGADASA